MRTVVCFIALLLSLCLVACSGNYTSKQMQVVLNETWQIVPGALVSREFFKSFNERPFLGRFFNDDEFQAGRAPVAVVSYKAWQKMFRSRPEAIGSRVEVDGRQTMIIGVAAPAFFPVEAGELWIPKP